ncbi:MAG: hypothetical protein AVDCRST_MAG93-4575, partial [uncultured Chloroflexia bacterium]
FGRRVRRPVPASRSRRRARAAWHSSRRGGGSDPAERGRGSSVAVETGICGGADGRGGPGMVQMAPTPPSRCQVLPLQAPRRISSSTTV